MKSTSVKQSDIRSESEVVRMPCGTRVGASLGVISQEEVNVSRQIQQINDIKEEVKDVTAVDVSVERLSNQDMQLGIDIQTRGNWSGRSVVKKVTGTSQREVAERIVDVREEMDVEVCRHFKKGEQIYMCANTVCAGCKMQKDMKAVQEGNGTTRCSTDVQEMTMKPLVTVKGVKGNEQQMNGTLYTEPREVVKTATEIHSGECIDMDDGFRRFPCRYAYKGCRKATLQKYNTAQHECSCKFRD